MNKQNKSFASRARALESRYKRLAFDSIEQKEFEAELEKLQLEQENIRQMMGLNQQEQPMQEFGNGGEFNPLPFSINSIAPQKLPEDAYLTPERLSEMGSPQINNYPPNSWAARHSNYQPASPIAANKGMQVPKVEQSQINTFTPVNKLMYKTNNNSLVNKPDFANFHNVERLGQQPIDTKTLGNMNTLSPEQITIMQQQAKDAGYGNVGYNQGKGLNKDILPYAISGASNIASNLLMAAMAKKNQQKVNPVLASPERMNMEPQAEQMRKDASVSKNIGMKQARDLGMNAGATLANMGAIGSGVDRNLANTLTNLYGQQEQYNVGAANQFALQNQDASNRAGMINAQFGNQANQDRLGYIGGALGTIPGVMKDVRMDKADKQMRDVMDRYYQSVGGRNYATVGSIFKDPASGFTYKVKPDLTLEKVK